jgi:hypothetical protein
MQNSECRMGRQQIHGETPRPCSGQGGTRPGFVFDYAVAGGRDGPQAAALEWGQSVRAL